MANLCFTTYTFYSSLESEIQRFHDFLSSLDERCKNGAIIIKNHGAEPQLVHSATYFLMQEQLNIPTDHIIDPIGTVYMVHDVYKKDMFYCFDVEMDDGWDAHPEAFENMIKWRFADIHISYMGIEPGNGYFCIHDEIGVYPYHYFVSGDIYPCKMGDDSTLYKQFVSKEECRQFVLEAVKKVALENGYPDVEDTVSLEELEAYANEHFDGDNYVNVYEFNRV